MIGFRVKNKGLLVADLRYFINSPQRSQRALSLDLRIISKILGVILRIQGVQDSGIQVKRQIPKKEIEINGVKISPLDFTSKLLFPKWKLKDGESDITVMKIVAEGETKEKKVRYTYELYDKYDAATDTHSMARTTGYTATMAVRMLAKGLYTEKGISPPEYIGKDTECVKFMLKGLEKRGVFYKELVEKI